MMFVHAAGAIAATDGGAGGTGSGSTDELFEAGELEKTRGLRLIKMCCTAP